MEGERKITGNIPGIATMFQNVVKTGFVCIWYGAHQIDIVLQGIYSKFVDDTFCQKLTRLTSYLQHQHNIFSPMISKALKREDTCWESMVKVIDLFKRKNIEIDMHINNKHPDCGPLPIWWIHLMVVAKLSRVTTTTFKSLQGHHFTVAMQRTHLVSMQTYLLHVVGGDGPLLHSEAAALDYSEWVLLE